MPAIADNLAAIQNRIRNAIARSKYQQKVHLVAVTKTQPVQAILEGIQAGVKIIGENRVQEAAGKFPLIGNQVQWHLIGHLQSNKVKKALSLFEMIHSVDSLELAREIDRQAGILGKCPSILLQVNVSGEAGKFGLSPQLALPVAEQISAFKQLKLCGLMTIPPFNADPEASRPHFRALSELKEQLTRTGILGLKYLSMGMSHDFEVAIEEGAHFVRIGSAIFSRKGNTC
ncbi:MAG: YggS family pyridoxal phosphate-dependent enzyme [Candidatus Schekmanbacteria bacterium]|nr:YggS family pyridoxal phosphate-dependent enzyme [Candidatus Schekmanbacteria bacterium]